MDTPLPPSFTYFAAGVCVLFDSLQELVLLLSRLYKTPQIQMQILQYTLGIMINYVESKDQVDCKMYT